MSSLDQTPACSALALAAGLRASDLLRVISGRIKLALAPDESKLSSLARRSEPAVTALRDAELRGKSVACPALRIDCVNKFTEKVPQRWVVILVFLAVYVPYCWLIFMDYPWNSYRWHWIKMWPVLPGVVLYFFTMVCVPRSWLPPRTDVVLYVFSSVLTALFLASAIFGLLRAKRAFWPLLAALFVLSCVFGFLAYSLMRA